MTLGSVIIRLVTNGLRWIHYDGTSRRCLGHVDGRDDEDEDSAFLSLLVIDWYALIHDGGLAVDGGQAFWMCRTIYSH